MNRKHQSERDALATYQVINCRRPAEPLENRPEPLFRLSNVDKKEIKDIKKLLGQIENLAICSLLLPEKYRNPSLEIKNWVATFSEGITYGYLNPLNVLRIKIVFEALQIDKSSGYPQSLMACLACAIFQNLDIHLAKSNQAGLEMVKTDLNHISTTCQKIIANSSANLPCKTRANAVAKDAKMLSKCLHADSIRTDLVELIRPLQEIGTGLSAIAQSDPTMIRQNLDRTFQIIDWAILDVADLYARQKVTQTNRNAINELKEQWKKFMRQFKSSDLQKLFEASLKQSSTESSVRLRLYLEDQRKQLNAVIRIYRPLFNEIFQEPMNRDSVSTLGLKSTVIVVYLDLMSRFISICWAIGDEQLLSKFDKQEMTQFLSGSSSSIKTQYVRACDMQYFQSLSLLIEARNQLDPKAFNGLMHQIESIFWNVSEAWRFPESKREQIFPSLASKTAALYLESGGSGRVTDRMSSDHLFAYPVIGKLIESLTPLVSTLLNHDRAALFRSANGERHFALSPQVLQLLNKLLERAKLRLQISIEEGMPSLEFGCLDKCAEIMSSFQEKQDLDETVFDDLQALGLLDYLPSIGGSARLLLRRVGETEALLIQGAEYASIVQEKQALIKEIYACIQTLEKDLPNVFKSAQHAQDVAALFCKRTKEIKRAISLSTASEQITAYLSEHDDQFDQIALTQTPEEAAAYKPGTVIGELVCLRAHIRRWEGMIPIIESCYLNFLTQIDHYAAMLGNLTPKSSPSVVIISDQKTEPASEHCLEQCNHLKAILESLDEKDFSHELKKAICIRARQDMLYHLITIAECIEGSTLWQMRATFEAGALMVEACLRYHFTESKLDRFIDDGFYDRHDLIGMAKELSLINNTELYKRAQAVVKHISIMTTQDALFASDNVNLSRAEVLQVVGAWIRHVTELMQKFTGQEQKLESRDLRLVSPLLSANEHPIQSLHHKLSQLLSASLQTPPIPSALAIEEKEPEIRKKVMARCMAKIEIVLPKLEAVFKSDCSSPYGFAYARQALIALSHLNHAVLLNALVYLPIPQADKPLWHICRSKVGNRPLMYCHDAHKLLSYFTRFFQTQPTYPSFNLNPAQIEALKFMGAVPGIHSRYLADQQEPVAKLLKSFADISSLMIKSKLSAQEKQQIDKWRQGLVVGDKNDDSQVMQLKFEASMAALKLHLKQGLTALEKLTDWSCKLQGIEL